MGPYELKGPISDDSLNKTNTMFKELYGVVNNLVGTITDEVYEKVIDGSKLNWKNPVDTYEELPSDASEGDTRMVREGEDGVSKIYRYNGESWKEIQEIDATAINEVDSRLSTSLTEKTTHLNSISIKLTETTKGKPVHTSMFILDDGYKLDLTLIKPIFDEKGIIGNTALISDRVGTGAYMTASEAQGLVDSGWEIASHSKTHTHLTSLSDEELVQELKGSRDALRNMGFDVNAFVTPFSDNDARTRSAIRKYFDHSFSRMSAAPNAIPVNMHDLKRTNMGDDVSRPFSYYKEYIDRGIKENSLMIICLHSNQFGSEEQKEVLKQTIDYLKSNNVDITTISEAMKRYGNAFEMWNEYTGQHTVISNSGEMFGSDLDYMVRLDTNSATPETPYNEFPPNKISFCKITASNSSEFPENRAGILITDNRVNEDGYTSQYYKILGRVTEYSRSTNTSGNWGSFEKVITDGLVDASITYNNNWSGNLEVSKNKLDQVIIRGRLTAGDISTPRTQVASLSPGFNPKILTAIPSIIPNSNVVNGVMVTVGGSVFVGKPLIDEIQTGEFVDINFIYQVE